MKNNIKPPKILILTQINPINIATVYNEIFSSYNDKNNIVSAQFLALMGELAYNNTDTEDNIHSYRVLNAAFVKHLEVLYHKRNPLQPYIVIGNCSKTVHPKQFDYILGFNGGEAFGTAETFDLYIQKDNEMLKDKNMEIPYYTPEDAEMFFPTLRHLKLFLETIGVERNEADAV